MTTREETFAVFLAGEQIEGTEIGLSYIYVTTALGDIRMTAEEANELGKKLIAAADVDHRIREGSEDQ